MKVSEVIAGQRVLTVRIDQSMGHAADIMRDHHVTGVPVVDEWGVLAGLVTTGIVGDVMRESAPRGLPSDPAWHPATRAVPGAAVDWRNVSVRDVMVTDLCTVNVGDDVRVAAQALINRNVHRAIVLGPDRNVAGVVSALDFTLLVAEGRH